MKGTEDTTLADMKAKWAVRGASSAEHAALKAEHEQA